MQDYFSDPGYVQAKQAADTAYQQYGTAQQNTLTLPDQLKSALDKKFASQDNPLFKMQENALNDYLNAGNTGYQAVLPENNNGMIFAPSSQQEQIAGRRNSALSSLAGTNSMIAGGFGGILDVIDKATKMYQVQELAAKLKSESARQKLADLIDEIKMKEEIRQFNESQATEKYKADKSSTSGLDAASILALLSMQDKTSNTEDDSDLDAFNEPDQPFVGVTPGLQFLNQANKTQTKSSQAIDKFLNSQPKQAEKSAVPFGGINKLYGV